MKEDHLTNLITLPVLILIFSFLSGGYYCLPIFGSWTYFVYKLRGTKRFYLVWTPLMLLTLVLAFMLGHLIYSAHTSLLDPTEHSGDGPTSPWSTTRWATLPVVAKGMLMFSITASPILVIVTLTSLFWRKRARKA